MQEPSDLERRLIESPRLPTLPNVAQRMLETLSDENCDLADVANLLSHDPSMASKVLRLVNSPFYGAPREVVSLQQAVLYLGIAAVRSVALSFSFIGGFRAQQPTPDGTPTPLDELWRTSLMNALAARQISREVGGWDPEEAFLAGLISDCGVLVMLAELPGYGELWERFRRGEGDLLELELRHLETNHTRISQLLLGHWRFPEVFRLLIAAHHEPGTLGHNVLQLRARILSGAWLCARALTVEGFTAETALLDEHLSKLLGINTTVARAIAEDLPDELREAADLFDIPATKQRSFDVLLEEANALLSATAVGSAARAPSESAGQWTARAAFAALRHRYGDELPRDEGSGLLDRQVFGSLVEEMIRFSRPARSSLSIVVVEPADLDHKEEMPEHHLDSVLFELSRRLQALLRSSDPLARFGEGQIAALAPGCGKDDARGLAERIRFELEREPVLVDGNKICTEVAIGVACASPHHDALDASTLLRIAATAADQAIASPERIGLGN